MRPTVRGVAVLLVALGATAVSTQYGQPGLSAIAVPLLVALVGATVQVYWTGIPSVERSALRRGFAGEQRTMTLTVEGSGIARLTDERPDGIGGPVTVRRSLPSTIEFEVPYERRGDHRLGPIAVTVTDALGLVVTSGTVDATDSVLVFPSVYRLGGEAFEGLVAGGTDERRAFDRLREYAPGDPLRDVHWKSSAKRDELLVTEFDDGDDDRELLVAARADEGCGDEMAAAAATIAVAALRSGYGVELATPRGTVASGVGERHQHRLLEALARAPSGESGREEAADVVVSATDADVSVTVDDRTRPLSALTAGRENPLVSEVSA